MIRPSLPSFFAVAALGLGIATPLVTAAAPNPAATPPSFAVPGDPVVPPSPGAVPPPSDSSNESGPSDTIPTPAPTRPAEDASVTERAKAWLLRSQHADIDRSQLTEKLSNQLTPQIAKGFSNQVKPLGELVGFSYLDSRKLQGYTVTAYLASFEHGKTVWLFAVDPSGKIGGLTLEPVGPQPSAAPAS